MNSANDFMHVQWFGKKCWGREQASINKWPKNESESGSRWSSEEKTDKVQSYSGRPISKDHSMNNFDKTSHLILSTNSITTTIEKDSSIFNIKFLQLLKK